MNCYDVPQYWDLAFSEDTRLEADFVLAAVRKYCDFLPETAYEPGCGGGRLIVELASRGIQMTGTDSSQQALDYAAEKLRSQGLSANLRCADITNFRCEQPVDVAFCFVNTFRHLLTETDARTHLQSVADSLRPGGLYLLGLHLFPPDADPEDSEEWTVTQGDTTVEMFLNVSDGDRKTRLETLQFRMEVSTAAAAQKQVFETDYRMRLYEAAQIQTLLQTVPDFELIDVFDFWYDLEEPLTLNDELGDTVLVLRKRSESQAEF